MRIITNSQPRPIVTRHEVPAEVLSREFNWTDPADPGAFFKYRGVWHELGEFARAPESLAGWDGFHGDRYFSGVVIRLADDGESVVCGLALS